MNVIQYEIFFLNERDSNVVFILDESPLPRINAYKTMFTREFRAESCLVGNNVLFFSTPMRKEIACSHLDSPFCVRYMMAIIPSKWSNA